MSKSQSEQGLIRRLLAGDEASFEEFFAETFPGLYRYALSRMNRDPDAAEEVVQAALSKAVGKLHTFRGDSALFTWLCTFCRHEISAYYRKWGRHPQSVELTENSPEVRSAVARLSIENDVAPGDRIEAEDRTRRIHVALDELSPRYADVLEWKYTQDLTVADIAGRLGCSEKAAESLLTRARVAFRERFERIERREVQPPLRLVSRRQRKLHHG